MGTLWATGGIVMLPLLGLSVVALTLGLERVWFWWRLGQRQTRLVERTLATYQADPLGVLAPLKQARHLPIARIFTAALVLDTPDETEFRLALESAAQAELPRLKRFQTVFETIVGIAPLLGLLGTVLGLIRVLASIDLGESLAGGSGGEVTAGIGEALVSTAVGLVVAMVALLLGNLFQGLYRRQRAFIQGAAGQLELAHRQRQRQQRDASHPLRPQNWSR